MHVWVRTCMWARLLGEGVTCAWKRLQRRHLAGSLPSSGFGFILPSPAGLGRPNCTDGHLAGTLGHGPVLTCKLLTPPFSASMTLLILQRTDWARTERHWRWKWAGDSSTGLAELRTSPLIRISFKRTHICAARLLRLERQDAGRIMLLLLEKFY